MKYDLSRMFMDYCTEEEAIEFTHRFWEEPFQKARKEAAEAIEHKLTSEEIDNMYEYSASCEELGFIEGFRLAVQFMATGVGARAPQVEVQG